MSKLVPSPDWFVGVDSLDLCENGRFIDSVTVEVRMNFKQDKNFFLKRGSCYSYFDKWLT